MYIYDSINASVPVLLLSLKYISNLRDVVVVSYSRVLSAHFFGSWHFPFIHTHVMPTYERSRASILPATSVDDTNDLVTSFHIVPVVKSGFEGNTRLRQCEYFS